MSLFVLRRLLTLLATLAGASVIIFLVLDALPGNAAQTLMGADASPDAIRALTVKLGLDQPLLYRYLHWIHGMAVGDLGNSYAYGTSVAGLIAERLALTIPLAILSMAIMDGDVSDAVRLPHLNFATKDRGPLAHMAFNDDVVGALSALCDRLGVQRVMGSVVHWAPGKRTAEYLDHVLTRITVIGAGYITIVCLLPEFLISNLGNSFYFGGTSILIVVTVTMDTVAQIQSHLLAHQYDGLIKKSKMKTGSKGAATSTRGRIGR